MKLLEDYGLDGLDIDYEYPQNDEQARGYTHLLKELRHALDEHQRKKETNYRFLLTVYPVSESIVDVSLTCWSRSRHLVVLRTTVSFMWRKWTVISIFGTLWHTIMVRLTD